MLSDSCRGFFFCAMPVEAAGWLTSSIKLTWDHNMLVILICIHWLVCGRHQLSSDLCSNSSTYSIQPYSSIVTSHSPQFLYTKKHP